MPRLRTLSPRVAALAPRLAPSSADHHNRDRRRDAEQPWRAWYRTARWQKLRLRILERDGYRCRQTGVMLVPGRDRPDSAVVDHIEPHRGDPARFWDEANLQAVAKAWHDREKQSRERKG